jgi:hypothetical protein
MVLAVDLGRYGRVPISKGWRLLEDIQLGDYAGAQDDIVSRLASEGASNQIRSARALVLDALRFLGRAEPALRERRRNVWWTTWFFERKLRAIAHLVWLSVLDQNSPVPFLGFEASPDQDTEADSLLDFAWRMIRVDSYRFATIVDAYASCARALQLRRLTSFHDKERYEERQRNMRKNLHQAISRLRRVRRSRNLGEAITVESAPTSRNKPAGGTLDQHIRKYIASVVERSALMVTHLSDDFTSEPPPTS